MQLRAARSCRLMDTSATLVSRRTLPLARGGISDTVACYIRLASAGAREEVSREAHIIRELTVPVVALVDAI